MLGFSLIECVIAAGLSLYLVAIGVTIYQSQQTMSIYTHAKNRLQENARLTEYLLHRSLRGAGYTGCLSADAIQTALNHLSASPGIHGDVLVFTKADSEISSVLEAAQTHIFLEAMPHLSAHDAIIISDCLHTETANILSIAGNTVSLMHPLQYRYEKTAQIGKLEHLMFYVAPTHRKSPEATTALYGKNLDNPSQVDELVEGVENLYIEYGIDEMGRRVYFSATDMRESASVKTIRVTWLMNSIEASSGEPEAYIWKKQQVMPHDHLLHEVWQTEIYLRNHHN